MNSSKRILWGIVFVILGLLAAVRVAGVEFDMFFKGWWTLFIIIPCAISAATDKNKTVGIVGTLIGVVLLCKKQGWLPWLTIKNIWSVAVPVALVAFGLNMIFKGAEDKQPKEFIKRLNVQNTQVVDCRAFFSKKQVENTAFNKAYFSATFGSVSCNLSTGKLFSDIVINTNSFFGSVNIYAPEGVNIKIVSSSVFSGITNQKTAEYPNAPTIYINNTSLFGGLKII
ncbi:MAG: hypothetical protein KBT46_02955 [Ruminococcus sp.]|nr:hypothetical protein [Candidatus Copronaster equi]